MLHRGIVYRYNVDLKRAAYRLYALAHSFSINAHSPLFGSFKSEYSTQRKAKVDRDHFFLSFSYMNCSSSVVGCIRESSIAKSLKVTTLTEDA